MKTRGRPKGKSADNRSFGPLGDLLRKKRLENGMGLLEVAQACKCSVQFVSNIEHGRAPLPWDKAPFLAKALGLKLEDLQIANLTIRSDFKGFMTGPVKGKRIAKPLALKRAASVASAIGLTASDPDLQKVVLKYQTADQASRRRFFEQALELLQ